MVAPLLFPALLIAGGLWWRRHRREAERKRHGRAPDPARYDWFT